MSASMVLFGAVLAALTGTAPLQVGVLERLHPVALSVQASSLRCDGRLVSRRGLQVRASGSKLQAWTAGGAVVWRCSLLEALGPWIQVRVASQERSYPGILRVRSSKGELQVRVEVPIEAYLPAVLDAELGGGGPAALLEAQAVVSRTYALSQRGRHAGAGYDVCDLAHCQVYPGSAGSKAARQAVRTTQGKVLLRGGQLVPAYFHASCGGATSAPEAVFGPGELGVGVSDEGFPGPWCREAPDFDWTWEIGRGELATALGRPATGQALVVVRRDGAGRVLRVRAFGLPLSGQQLWRRLSRAFGYSALKSQRFVSEEVLGKVRFRGRGLGHGVGLCQAGAGVLARRGRPALDLLGHYFPDRLVGPAPPSP